MPLTSEWTNYSLSGAEFLKKLGLGENASAARLEWMLNPAAPVELTEWLSSCWLGSVANRQVQHLYSSQQNNSQIYGIIGCNDHPPLLIKRIGYEQLGLLQQLKTTSGRTIGSREFQIACQTHARGIRSPMPYALLQSGNRLATRQSLLFSEWLDDTTSLADLFVQLSGDRSLEHILKLNHLHHTVATFVGKMIELGMLHEDFHPLNLLIRPVETSEPYLIDLWPSQFLPDISLEQIATLIGRYCFINLQYRLLDPTQARRAAVTLVGKLASSPRQRRPLWRESKRQFVLKYGRFFKRFDQPADRLPDFFATAENNGTLLHYYDRGRLKDNPARQLVEQLSAARRQQPRRLLAHSSDWYIAWQSHNTDDALNQWLHANQVFQRWVPMVEPCGLFIVSDSQIVAQISAEPPPQELEFCSEDTDWIIGGLRDIILRSWCGGYLVEPLTWSDLAVRRISPEKLLLVNLAKLRRRESRIHLPIQPPDESKCRRIIQPLLDSGGIPAKIVEKLTSSIIEWERQCL